MLLRSSTPHRSSSTRRRTHQQQEAAAAATGSRCRWGPLGPGVALVCHNLLSNNAAIVTTGLHIRKFHGLYVTALCRGASELPSLLAAVQPGGDILLADRLMPWNTLLRMARQGTSTCCISLLIAIAHLPKFGSCCSNLCAVTLIGLRCCCRTTLAL